MAAEIRRVTGGEASLIKGDNGVFEVKRDGDLIFSKHRTGRFPEHAEILERLGGSG
ncbi:MAG: Rdx family protein [Proteobacteria bacterium]|nr:Rdx family protein [Pseudomonadota bacterium]